MQNLLLYPYKDKNCKLQSSSALSLSPSLSSTKPFNPISSASASYLYVHELELNSKRSSLGADWTEPSPSQACTWSQTSAAATELRWSVQPIANKAVTQTHGTMQQRQRHLASHLTLMRKPDPCALFILSRGILKKILFHLLTVISVLRDDYQSNI